MTPKEKAIEIYNKFWDAYQHDPVAHECALICVKEIELYRRVIEKEYSEDLYHAYGIEEYWKKVKQEINKL